MGSTELRTLDKEFPTDWCTLIWPELAILDGYICVLTSSPEDLVLAFLGSFCVLRMQNTRLETIRMMFPYNSNRRVVQFRKAKQKVMCTARESNPGRKNGNLT